MLSTFDLANHHAFYLKSMEHTESSLSPRWLFIEQWRQTVPAVCDSNQAEQPLTCDRPDASSHKRGVPSVLDMSTPPLSDRARSPPKRIKLSHRNRDLSLDDDDGDDHDPFLAHASLPDLVLTSRHNTTASIIANPPELPPFATRSVANSTSGMQASSAASRTTTSTTKSRARSASPTKKTQGLVALKKPIYHVPLDDKKKEQLPEDVRVLYNRLYDITVEHEGVAPWEIREEINGQLARPWRESWFKRRETPSAPSGADAVAEEEEYRDLARVELRALRKIKRTAWKCRERGRSEAAWNTMVHAPLLQLALNRPEYAHVGWEVVTTAQIAKHFVPRMGDFAPTEFADKKMVDLAMVLEPDVSDDSEGEEEAKQQNLEQRFRHLAHAIQRVVRSQPYDRQSINQSMYTPLLEWPIGISIETKAVGANEAGRVQLAIWTAAWHERIKDLMMTTGTWSSDTLFITMPLLLIVEHNWVLSFACDRGDRLEVVGEMTLGETASLKGLYTLVAVLRELAVWMQGRFAEWMLGVLERC